MKELTDTIFGMTVQYEQWNMQNLLPFYISTAYTFQSATIDGIRCIMLTPIEELDTLPALRKQIGKIQEIDNLPVVLHLSAVSFYRRKSLIENKIPFITAKQAYLPFMATFLEDEKEPEKQVTKFMFSTQQLVLLYLYSQESRLYISEATKKLPFSAMTLSRAVKQLEAVGLFYVTKEGVNKVIEAKYPSRELFERIKGYLSTPVRTVGYLEKVNITDDMVIAGETALAEKTMLNMGRITTYAVYVKSFDKTKLMNELVDPKKQIRLELWEYDPKQFGKADMADGISVALSLLENTDERVEENVEELLESEFNK